MPEIRSRKLRGSAKMGFDFGELTLEPPASIRDKVAAAAMKRSLDRFRLDVMKHAPELLPMRCPFTGIRQATVDELKGHLGVWESLGAKSMRLHIGPVYPVGVSD